MVNDLLMTNLPTWLKNLSKVSLGPHTIRAEEPAVSVTLTGLTMSPTALQCTYASIGRQTSGNGAQSLFGFLFNVSSATVELDITVDGKTAPLSLTVEDLTVCIRGTVDLNLRTSPQISTFKCSLGNYQLNGTAINLLEGPFPLLYEILRAATSPHDLAAYVNSEINQDLLNAINSPIQTQFDAFQGLIKTFLTSAVNINEVWPTTPPPAPDTPNNGQSKWMSNDTIQGKTLGSLKFPGTHDSPTYVLTSRLSPQIESKTLGFILNLLSPDPIPGPTPGPTKPKESDRKIHVGASLYNFIMGQCIDVPARAQDTTISTQLLNGIRHFDLRLMYDPQAPDGFNYQHTIAGTGFTGILQQFNTFLSTPGTTELVFALISDTNFTDHVEQMDNFTKPITQNINAEHIYCPANYDPRQIFEMKTLYNTTIRSITNGSSKIMFLFADSSYMFTNTVVNSPGFPCSPWNYYARTVQDLVNHEMQYIPKPPYNGSTQDFWNVKWSVDANRGLITRYIVDRFAGVENWVLQDGAHAANAVLPAFLASLKTNRYDFNLVTCDWFEAAVDVAALVIALNGQ